MNITKDENTGELVIRLPFKQHKSNPYDKQEEQELTANLVGICAGDEYSLSQSIDMSYKGKGPQEGMPIVSFESKDELERVCKEFDIDLWTLPVCAYCQKAIRGLFIVGEKGNQCYDCVMTVNY